MILSAGDKLGPYEVLEHIGAGGMGEVYKARDTRLNRTVAIKVSNDRFSDRFAREARAVAALNHPHICTLYDVGVNYLVMEYVDGLPLRGPMPEDKAVGYAKQILDALEHAHKLGITHRDLKPANILVTKQGIKLLDFGLARIEDGSDDPTLTQVGQVLGTPAYMAPEQWGGQRGDARSDMYAFGCVLHEILTGKRAAESQTLPTSSHIGRVVKACLDKDPDGRWQSAHDLKVALDLTGSDSAPSPERSRERTMWIAVVAALLAALLYFALLSTPSPPGELVRFDVLPPENVMFSGPVNVTVGSPQFALSPDSRYLAFVATTAGARPNLWMRPLKELTGYSLPGTEGAEHPFWSLEGDEVGFFAEGKLKKIRATGGPVQIVSTQLIDDPRGGSWGPNGTILVGTGSGGIFKLSSGAGEMVPVTKLEAGKEGSHRWPHFLPDGKHFLFAVRSELPERRGTYIGSLDGTVQPLITGEDPSNARYVEPGFLLFMQGDTLMAQPFDADRLTRSGRATPVAQHVGRSSNTYSSFSATTSGALAWAGPNLESGRLTWFDKNGTQRAVVSPVGDYTDFRLSHSEDRLAWSLVDPKFGVPQISITEFERGTTSPFTSGPALNAGPVWSLDDSFLIFRTTRRGGTVELYKNSSAGGGKDELVLGAEAQRAAGQVSTTNTSSAALSPDGKNLVYSNAGSAGSQLWVLPLSEQKPTNLLNSEASIMHATFSPIGGLIAYTSDPRGSMQVIVETFPRSDKKWTVSTAGGYEPRWSSDGREIYYLSPDRNLMSVSVESGPVFRAPKVLFQTKVAPGINAYRRHYVVSKDGRFLINAPTRDFAPTPITVMLNWVADLKE